MRALVLGMAAALIFLTLSTACTKKQAAEDRKKVDDLIVSVIYSKMPLVKGKNDLKITVTDTAGRSISAAMIETRLYTTDAGRDQTRLMVPGELKNGVYSFMANMPVAGDWKMDVMVRPLSGNKAPASTTFAFRVE